MIVTETLMGTENPVYLQGDRAMSRKNVCIQLVILLLACTFYIAPYIHPANAKDPNIYIRANGAIEPSNVSISSLDNITYTFTADMINRSIIVEKSNIIIDGMKHKLIGKGAFDVNVTGGFKINDVSGVTIRKVKISNCYWAVYLTQCNNCTIEENELTNNSYGIVPEWSNNSIILRNKIMNNHGGGIYLANSLNFSIKQNLIASKHPFGIGLQASTNSTITENVIANNDGVGIRILFSNNIRLLHNDFVNNVYNAFSQSSTIIWDDGSEGNYWSDYNGTDVNHDGIGDTPYAIDSNNADRYPFMRPLTLTLMGDINYDGVVNILDITIIGSAYGSKQTDPNYIPQADLAPPYGVINMLDAVTCAAHYAETFP